MAKELTYKDLCEILSTKCYVSEVTVERVLENLILLIASELQNNSYIKIKNLGKFSTELRGGKDEWTTDKLGQMVKRYVEQFQYVDFEPSNNLLDVVNGESVNYLFRKFKVKYDKPVAFEDLVLDNTDTQPDKIADSVSKIIAKRKDKRKKKQETKQFNPNSTFAEYNKTKQQPILCKNNNIIYPSIYRASIELGIPYTTLKSHIDGDKADMKYKGYKFEILKKEEEE